MGLKDLKLKFKYRSSTYDLAESFYNRCIRQSIQYDRAAGYFTSESLILISLGLKDFLNKDGKIRIISNPYLTEEDYEAIRKGYLTKEDAIKESLIKEIEKIKDPTSIQLLTYLIYKGILDIKIAFSIKNGIYHEKFGIFKDYEGYRVAFIGSSNETSGGLSNNFEIIQVTEDINNRNIVNSYVKDFENLWSNNTQNLQIINIPDVVINKLYKTTNIQKFIENRNYINFNVEKRTYQIEAINAIKENEWKGVLEMATGTGKTYTSLLAAQEYLQDKNRLFLVILVPFKHLIEQWIKNIKKMGFSKVINCSSDNLKWTSQLHRAVRDYNIKISNVEIVLTTYDTASRKKFLNYIEYIRDNGFLISDECHYFGQKRMKNHKFSHFEAKIGLSATPSRWNDIDGTKLIDEFFSGVVYRYSLDKAIENNFLTKYNYYPIITDINEEEIRQYEELTKKIIILNQIEDKTEKEEKSLEQLIINRSKIIKQSSLKIDKLLEIFSEKNIKEVNSTLIYCAEGTVNQITRKLNDLGYKVHKFNHEVSNEKRQKILNSFANKDIQILVAVNCLDEGVDVPSTKFAYFLSSTSNPRQFIQRRGRILRNCFGKNRAELYDFITIPMEVKSNTFESIVRKEIPRFIEFSNSAINKNRARRELENNLIYQDLDFRYLLDDELIMEYIIENDLEE